MPDSDLLSQSADIHQQIARSRAIREAVRKKKSGNTDNSGNSARLPAGLVLPDDGPEDRKKENVDLET